MMSIVMWVKLMTTVESEMSNDSLDMVVVVVVLAAVISILEHKPIVFFSCVC